MVGMHRYGERLYPYANVPSLLSVEDWERVVAKLEHKPAAPSEIRLLSNIAQCGICENHLRAGGRQWKGTRSRDPEEYSYRCRVKTKGRDDGACGKLFVTGPLADTEVSRRTIAWISNRENVTNLLLRSADPAQVEKIQTRVAELTESLNALSKALSPPPGIPRMPLETYYARAAEIEEERKALGRKLAVTRETGMLAELLEVEDVETEWHSRPVQWRRAILKLVTLSIVIEPRGKGPKGQRAHLRTFDKTRVRIVFADG
jgi:hypothetical protein